MPYEYVINYLTEHLGAKFEDNSKLYEELSPFNYAELNGGRSKLLKDISIRLYVEPDVNWYIQNRGKDYLDMNSIDCAALVNRLKLMGNKKAELIITKDKGIGEDGKRDPHSWSIVDEEGLVDWAVGILQEQG